MLQARLLTNLSPHPRLACLAYLMVGVGACCYEPPMPKPQIRRARRTDFTAVMELLATSGVPVPPADRATLRRFRNLVNDLSGDFYLAFDEDLLLGLVHATYSRQLATAPIARIETLVARAHQDEVAVALLLLIRERATRRGCGQVVAAHTAVNTVADAALTTAGLTLLEALRVG